MRAFAGAWPDEDQFVAQPVRQIPWGHNITLLGDSDDRLWYAAKAIENGWSRAVLALQIENNLRGRLGAAPSNLPVTLAKEDSALMQAALKDPYDFGFLQLPAEVAERQVELGLIEQIRYTLLELGIGFVFIGNQHHLEVGGDDFYPDLLFFHIPTNRYVVIDLKAGEFKPEFAGKMSFYVTAIDMQAAEEWHNPTVGIVLCRGRNATVTDYSLQGIDKPLVVVAYTTGPSERLKALPPAADLEATIERVAEETEGPS